MHYSSRLFVFDLKWNIISIGVLLITRAGPYTLDRSWRRPLPASPCRTSEGKRLRQSTSAGPFRKLKKKNENFTLFLYFLGFMVLGSHNKVWKLLSVLSTFFGTQLSKYENLLWGSETSKEYFSLLLLVVNLKVCLFYKVCF